MKKSQKIRTLLRSSATKSIKEIVAELDKETPSRETIRINFKVLDTNENQLRDVNSQIMNLMLEDETITAQDLEKEQDMRKEEHDETLREVLRRLKNSGITLNKEKCQFGVNNVTFLGHYIDEHGIKADEKKVKAIAEMKPPTDVHGVQRFMGMVNFLGRFVPNLAEITKPLNDLRKKDVSFIWGLPQKKAFEKVKDVLASDRVLASFDISKKTMVSADASSYGLGAVLKQEHESNEWRPVAFASRTLTKTEQGYAQIEKEALAITWAYHKPLVPIFTTKDLNDLTPRLQRYRMRMLQFLFHIFHTPGKDLITADALSRQPLPGHLPEDEELQEEVEHFVRSIVLHQSTTDDRLAKIALNQKLEPTLQNVAFYSKNGWPAKCQLSPLERSFYDVRDEIGEENGLLMRGLRVIIPSNMRKDVLNRIHAGHQGITKCRARAKDHVWWPGIGQEIQDMVKTCEKCIENQPLKHEPLIPNDFPKRPWQKVGMDLFHYEGSEYLVVVDYLSRFIEVVRLTKLSSEAVVDHCKAIFARHGIPDIVISDNGPQFRPSTTSAFTKYASEVGFRHITSSPKHPQSNGQAEAAVKIVKNLMKKNKDPVLALMEYRATPLANGLSTAELLFGRKIRTMVPCTSSSLTPKTVDQSKLRGEEEQRKMAQKTAFDRRHAATKKAELIAGEKVWVKDLRAWGSVLEKASAPRSYIVETPVGTYRRNSLLLASSQQQVDPSETSSDSELPAETEETPGNELPAEELQQMPAIAPEIKQLSPSPGKVSRYGKEVRWRGYSEDEGELPITIDQRLQRPLEFLRREVKGKQRLEYIREGFGESSQRKNYGQHVSRMHTAQIKDAQGGRFIRDACENRNPKGLVSWPSGRRNHVAGVAGSGSQSSFVHQDLHHHLTVPVHKVNAQIYGINDTRGEHVKQMVACSVESLTESVWTIPIKALVVTRMTGTLPSRDLRIPVPSSWKALPLADPQFETSGRVDVILGADVYGSLLLPEFKYDEKTQLCAQKTRLGWIISGKLPSEGGGSPHMVYNIRVNYEENLDNILRRFWEVKEVPIRPDKSGADEFCEDLYKTKRQLSLERRLAKQVPLKEEYRSFMRECIKLGHMTPLPELVAEDSPGGCFIPHHAVLVYPTDAARQKILWRETSNEPMIPYRLNTVTYGTSPAPFLALRTLIQLTIVEGSQYPRAAEALRKETGDLFSRSGLPMIRTIFYQIPEDARLKKILFDGAEVMKTLGLGWDPVGDYFLYSFLEPTKGDEITKRGMLLLVAKLYDPMGWLAPLIVLGKIMIKRLWVAGKDWDAPIDGPIKEQWKKFREQLGCLRTVRIPRWLGLMGIQDIQLHGFSDASEDAADLVAAKTRLAPVRRISIPRLELCAAVLLTRLITHILTVVRLDLGTIVCWTDATIVLAWIKTIARTLPTFVGNRLVLSNLRQEYWILRAKDQIKKCVRECVICCRYNRTTQLQVMSDLPKESLTPGKPFTVSEVDYAGPIQLKLYGGRGRKVGKGYICLFVCFVTRAVHIELVTDASTPTFLAAFKRFVARRGRCNKIYSDQGTNFVGAAKKLQSDFYLSRQQLKELTAILANDGTEWWSTDFIHSLQQRNKWKTKESNMLAGSLGFIKEGHVPPAKWLMGRVVEVHPGKDGVVRVVSLRTMAGVIKRPLVKLALLQGPPVSFDGAHQLGEDVHYRLIRLLHAFG
ncbi:K02A2.6-like [Cordylochernes scorpioides]|uniref:RNA-directed DNA polymerase n=1 Tax=Cordylochernes scorpioides TaxID=51811 RepID=A0ABY6KKI5_9ARAC|nr:K02A2.6-like [Cordylochernes scorpioides]